MVTSTTEGTIVLEKFELDEDEMSVIKKMIAKYANKIARYVEYEQIKLEMKVHQKAKSKYFEIRGHITYPGNRITSEQEDRNPYVAVDLTLGKMLKELQNKGNKK